MVQPLAMRAAPSDQRSEPLAAHLAQSERIAESEWFCSWSEPHIVSGCTVEQICSYPKNKLNHQQTVSAPWCRVVISFLLQNYGKSGPEGALGSSPGACPRESSQENPSSPKGA